MHFTARACPVLVHGSARWRMGMWDERVPVCTDRHARVANYSGARVDAVLT